MTEYVAVYGITLDGEPYAIETIVTKGECVEAVIMAVCGIIFQEQRVYIDDISRLMVNRKKHYDKDGIHIGYIFNGYKFMTKKTEKSTELSVCISIKELKFVTF